MKARFSLPTNRFSVFRAMESHFRAFSSSRVGAPSGASPTSVKSFFRDCATRSSTVISDMVLRSTLGSNLPSGSMIVLPKENPLFKNGKFFPAPFTPGGNGGLSMMPERRLVDRRDGSGGISTEISEEVDNSSPNLVDAPCFQDADPRSFLLKLVDRRALPSTMVNSWQVDDVASALELELERRLKNSTSPRLKGGCRSFLELLDMRETDNLSFGPNKVCVLRSKMSAQAKSLHRCCMTTSEMMIRWPSLLPDGIRCESSVCSSGGSPSNIPSVRQTCLFVLIVPLVLSRWTTI